MGSKQAARFFDTASHPGLIVSGALDVLINNRPAATVGSWHVCSLPPTAGPHSPTKIVSGSSSVWIGGRPAARVSDRAGCGSVIVSGSPNVRIGG
jgi:uncharacterized Zn-binding protein involved in type VI secretion